MNDVLFNLYSVSGDPAHLATARRFNAFVFTARLAEGQDDLADQPFPHANFHLPEIIGNARGYELTANDTDRAVVQTFYDALTSNHSYATGGSNVRSIRRPPNHAFASCAQPRGLTMRTSCLSLFSNSRSKTLLGSRESAGSSHATLATSSQGKQRSRARSAKRAMEPAPDHLPSSSTAPHASRSRIDCILPGSDGLA